jgi:outer membrane receptor protein involved in Fe transport
MTGCQGVAKTYRVIGMSAASLAFAFAATPALAQETPPAAQADANVTSYPPSFFSQFRPNTAFDMITRLPGFSFDGGSNARGFEGTAGNVLIDGQRPPSRSDSLGSVLSRIPASAVVRIDVVRGGAGGIDMQGKPIIANVIRKKDAGLTGSFGGSYNNNSIGGYSNGANLQVQNQSGGNRIEGALNYNHGDTVNEEHRTRVNPQGATILEGRFHADGGYDVIQATGSWELPLFGGNLRLNGQLSNQSNNYDGVETLLIPGGAEITSGDTDRDYGEAGIRFTRSLGDYNLEVVGFQSLTNNTNLSVFNTPQFTSGTRSETDSGESIARAILKWPKMGDISIETGAETAYNFQKSQSARSLNNAPFVLGGDASEANELRTQGFGSATWAPSSKLSLEAGARYEWSRIEADGNAGTSEKTLGFFKPRLNLSWRPTDGRQVGVRLERLVEQLSFGAFASSAQFDTQVFGIGNPEIEPEKSWNLTARYERQLGGQSSYVIEYIHREIEDVLGRTVVMVQTTPTGTPQLFEITRNVGDASRDSLDMHGSLELDKWGFKGGIVNAGIVFRDSNTRDPVTQIERRMSNEEPFSWNFNVQQTLDNGNFRWALFLEGDEPNYSYSPRSVSKFDPTVFVGANITWKPGDGWTWGAGVNNFGELGSHFGNLFYNNPRSFGTPLYYELTRQTGNRTAFINFRKNF